MNRQSRDAVVPSSSAPSRSRDAFYTHPLLEAIQSVLRPELCDEVFTFRSHARWSGQSLAITAVFAACSEAARLGDRFDEAREALTALAPDFETVGMTYRGFSKALGRSTPKTCPALRCDLQRQIEVTAGDRWTIDGWIPLTADGSKFDLPRTHSNLSTFGAAGKRGSGPQALVTMLWHMGAGLPWDWRIGPVRSSERQQLHSMLDEVPPNSIIVGDAGFVGFDMMKAIHRRGRAFLIRAAGNASLLTGLRPIKCESGDTVYVWPKEMRTSPPLMLRLITLRAGKGKPPVKLVTNILDRRALSRAMAGRFYRMRWGVEVQYRTLKQTMERRKMLSRSASYAHAELEWTIIGCTVLGLLQAKAMAAAGISIERASFASGLRVLRRFIRQAWQVRINAIRLQLADIFDEFAKAVKDTYQRDGPKSRTTWAMKKRPPTLQPPLIRPATDQERRRAERVIQNL